MMMVGLANIAGGINLLESRSHQASNQSYINTLLAGAGGALGVFTLSNLYLYYIWKEENHLKSQES